MAVSLNKELHVRNAILSAMVILVGCGAGPEVKGADEVLGETGSGLTFEQFKQTMAHYDEVSGDYIASGDERFGSEAELKAFYDESRQGQLIVNRVGNRDDRWSATQVQNLTYCVSNSFGSLKSEIVRSMASAAANWSSAARVRYVYVPSQDANCTNRNSSVVFNVRPTNQPPQNGGVLLAFAFFPSNARRSREVVVNVNQAALGLNILDATVVHELGHTLGFRHEHTRPEAGTCFEDNQWRALTAYDRNSIMHYPQCNGTPASSTVLTARDRQGVAALYGAP